MPDPSAHAHALAEPEQPDLDAGSPHHDTLIVGGSIVDGSGAEPYRADLAISYGRIDAIGQLAATHTASSIINAADRYILPGFIDAHSHGEAILTNPHTNNAALAQGVTTLIIGQDGLSYAPSSRATVEFVEQYFGALNGPSPHALIDGGSVERLLALFDHAAPTNIAYLLPLGNVRFMTLGLANRAASPRELKQQRAEVERGLEQGALGVSTGLDYVPGAFASTAELSYLCAPVTDAGGVHASHLRGYHAKIESGIRELAQICRASGVAGHISHLRAPARPALALMDELDRDGLRLTFDSYPYTRGATILAKQALPVEWLSGDINETISRLTSPRHRAWWRRNFYAESAAALSALTISSADVTWADQVEGVTLGEAAKANDQDLGSYILDLLAASRLRVSCVVGESTGSTEADMRALLRDERHLAGSDGILLGGRPHPRGWGSFARLLARHTRDLGDWTWGEAAYHLAGHAARRFRLSERGQLQMGNWADVVVLDPRELTDPATYDNPTANPAGVEYVFVNGVLAYHDREILDRACGRALRSR